VDFPYINDWILTWHSLDLTSTIGLKTCSSPLFHSGNLHLIFWVIIIIPKNISDISQKRPVRLLILNPLPFIMAKTTLSAVSGSTRIGSFVMKTNSQRRESMLASFQRVACLFTIYYLGICKRTNGRRTGRGHISRRTTRLERLCMGAMSLYDGEGEIMVMMYDTEQPRVYISALTPAARLSQTTRSRSANKSDAPPNFAYSIALLTICYLYRFFQRYSSGELINLKES
jgi:hypothetical protein